MHRLPGALPGNYANDGEDSPIAWNPAAIARRKLLREIAAAKGMVQTGATYFENVQSDSGVRERGRVRLEESAYGGVFRVRHGN